jgi:hypothetical protein
LVPVGRNSSPRPIARVLNDRKLSSTMPNQM